LNPHLKSCTAAKPFKPIKSFKEKENSKKEDLIKTFRNSFSLNFSKVKNENTEQKNEINDENIIERKEIDVKEHKEDVFEEEKRVECSICLRKFTEERIEKHEKACKNVIKKRPLFDSSSKRVFIKIKFFY